jgi:ATP synthase, subunit C
MNLTENMANALAEAVDVHARTNDPQMIDFVCDKYCFADIIEAAEASKNSFVKGYVSLWIDTVNLKTFARVKKMGQPWNYFENVFIPGGTVDLQVFLGSYEDDFKQATEKFQAYNIAKAVSEGGEQIDNSGDFTLLEKICDNLLVEYSREAKTVTFGLEPLVSYLVARQNEVKAIRIVLAGKLAKMSPELIRERLRETYE